MTVTFDKCAEQPVVYIMFDEMEYQNFLVALGFWAGRSADFPELLKFNRELVCAAFKADQERRQQTA